jgi:FtsH-binding integral membrane protein
MNMIQSGAIPQASPLPRVEIRPLLRNVYLWMVLGLLVTAGSAYLTVTTPSIRNLLLSPWVAWGIFIVQLILVIILAAAVQRMSPGVATLIFLAYAALTGFSLSLLVLYYDLGTLTAAFVSTAALFVVMSIVGAFTKMDLTRFGTYLFIGLIGLIIASFLNIFFRSSTFDFIISLIGVALFTALTAVDTQKIVRLASDPRIQGQDSSLMRSLSILGALTLYLDFLNLFLFLVRIIGRSRN